MPDAHYSTPRLAEIYDALDHDRHDLEPYLGMVEEFGARSVLDVGCGTGCLALLLAERGVDVTGVDPALASLEVARAKHGAERIRWLHGDARRLPALTVDLATMTGNAAQAIVDPADWAATLGAVRAALVAGGRFVFETRDPSFEGWREWNRDATGRSTNIPGVGVVRSWTDLVEVALPIVRFRATYRFDADGAELTSESTLRFRTRAEVEADLAAAGFAVDEVREAPDRPGREFVFVARAVD